MIKDLGTFLGRINLPIFFGIIFIFVIAVKLFPFPYDDAYIHFRIAENLSTNFAPYFNKSEKIMGTSSFLWVIILAFFNLFPLTLILKVAIFNAVVSILGLLVWVHLLKCFSIRKNQTIVISLFALCYVGFLISSTVGLMETPLAICFLGLAIYFVKKGKLHGWAILGVIIFLRVELIIFVLLFGLTNLNKSLGNSTKKLVTLTIPLLFLGIICYYFYNTLIPHTMIAKTQVFKPTLGMIANNFFESIFPDFILSSISLPYRISYLTKLWYPLLSAIIILFFVGVIWSSVEKNKNFQTQFLILSAGLIIGLSYILKQAIIQEWYVPLYAIPITFVIFSNIMTNQIFSWFTIAIISFQPIKTILIFMLAICSPSSINSSLESQFRVNRYLEIGSFLNNLYPSGELMTSEIGALGYTYKAKIIDGVGLISPEALTFHPLKVPHQRSNPLIGAIPTKFIKYRDPEVIVSYPIFVEEFESSKDKENYRRIRIPGVTKSDNIKFRIKGIWGNKDIYIYIRNDLYKTEIEEKIQLLNYSVVDGETF